MVDFVMTTPGEITAGRILEAGRQLIMRRGYAGFSYADISDAVDIRKASIHHHFPTKSDLAVAVVKQYRELFDTDMAALQASGADALTQLQAYIGFWQRCIADDSAPFCVAGMLGAELPALPDEVAQEVRAHFENIAKWLENTLEAGSQSNQLQLKESPKSEAATFLSVVYGAMLAARIYGNAEHFKRVTDDAVARLIHPDATASK
jgi:TetR/AcrR family transcriptional regulator, transcriptional repressor for nem operon